MEHIQYYCVGFTWSDFEPENQLPRFIDTNTWENGFENRYIDRVNSVPVGSKLAAKTTYTRKENGETISVLKIHQIGTVTKNFKDGKTLKVKWTRNFKPITIDEKGAYRSTISRILDRETVKLIFGDEIVENDDDIVFYREDKIKKDFYLYPCFVLTRDRWDDFGFKTQYFIEYHEGNDFIIEIGHAKFWNKETNDGELPDSFIRLDENICSVGQSNYYYTDLRDNLDSKISSYYLNSVNDLATNLGLKADFEHEFAVNKSLLRSSEAQKAFREGNRIYKNIDIKNQFKFTFSTHIANAEAEHSIKFDFSEFDGLPFRIKVIIGKNGTGKTQYIARLASTLSGYSKQGNFSTRYLPPFSRVIAISYSLFDSFPRPEQTKTFSYYYCGFQGKKGFLSASQINGRLSKAINIIEKSSRTDIFGRYITMVLSEEIALDILDEDFSNFVISDLILYNQSGYSRYSSGQIITILIIAELVAYITMESLVIIDEPETHLHPNSVSLFLNVVNLILNKFDSYSIITTHSPQVVQEVPSKDVIVLERIDNIPIMRSLNIESFGENLNTITERIFHTAGHDEYYRKVLLGLAKEKSFSEIVKLFERNSLPLSLSARIYLQSLYE